MLNSNHDILQATSNTDSKDDLVTIQVGNRSSIVGTVEKTGCNGEENGADTNYGLESADLGDDSRTENKGKDLDKDKGEKLDACRCGGSPVDGLESEAKDC